MICSRQLNDIVKLRRSNICQAIYVLKKISFYQQNFSFCVDSTRFMIIFSTRSFHQPEFFFYPFFSSARIFFLFLLFSDKTNSFFFLHRLENLQNKHNEKNLMAIVNLQIRCVQRECFFICQSVRLLIELEIKRRHY